MRVGAALDRQISSVAGKLGSRTRRVLGAQIRRDGPLRGLSYELAPLGIQ